MFLGSDDPAARSGAVKPVDVMDAYRPDVRIVLAEHEREHVVRCRTFLCDIRDPGCFCRVRDVRVSQEPARDFGIVHPEIASFGIGARIEWSEVASWSGSELRLDDVGHGRVPFVAGNGMRGRT